ncbi:DUF6414 family protein [Acetobacterium wieringae]|uniref:DUF6414 family protein n=1 Tax=Acetobacterium wieringae TaxID=52694 RepID=UPI003158825F
MKDFLYLDTDYLDSYLSQINNGLIEKTTDSVTDQNELKNEKNGTEKEMKTEVDAETKIGFPGFASVKGTGKIMAELKMPKSSLSFTETEIGQSIITRSVHDNALNDFFIYIDENKLYHQEPKLSSFYYNSIDFKLIDFEYIYQIFNNDLMKKLVPAFSHKAKPENGQPLNLMDSLKLCIEVFPFSSFLYGKNFIVPLKPDFLRGKSNELIFKYSGKISVLGKTTRKVGLLSEMNAQLNIEPNPFETTYQGIDDIFVQMLKSMDSTVDDKPYIISPIAIFCE